VVCDVRRELPDPRFEAAGIIFTVEQRMEVLLDEARRLSGLAGCESMSDRILDQALTGKPIAHFTME
jgi:hypothetical protein